MADGRPVVLHGGTVHAEVGAAPVEALAIADGVVVAAGSLDDVRARAGSAATSVDLAGATLLPGLIDTHPHLLHFGTLAEPLVPLWDAVDHADIVAAIAERATSTPPGEWIMASPVGEPHYFLRRSWRDLAEGVLPDRWALDSATAGHPVIIQAWAPVTPNVCVLNSAGLARAGIDRTSPERIGDVWVERDADGEPTGRLHGSVNNYYNAEPFWDGFLRQLPLLQPEAAFVGTNRAMARYNELGVTSVYEAHAMGHLEIGLYRLLAEQGALRVRVATAPEAEICGMPWSEPLDDAAFESSLQRALEARGEVGDLLRVDGVTVARGGPCWPGLLLMREPYRGPYGEWTTGVDFLGRDKARRAMAFCRDNGLRLNLVVAGDREHDETLDDLEQIVGASGAARGWVLQHVYGCEPGQAARYAALGLDVTTSVSFSWGKGDLFAERIGDAYLEHVIPLRRLVDAGLTVACGSDWGPKNVFEQIALAEAPRFASGRTNAGPAQVVDRVAAVRMWTSEAAAVLRWPGLGRLRPGDHADAIVVDRDPLLASNDDLAGTVVHGTLLAGEVVHDDGALADASA